MQKVGITPLEINKSAHYVHSAYVCMYMYTCVHMHYA